MPQFMATEMRVVMMPWGVVLQPIVSINAEGHTMYIRSVLLPIAKIPLTPYQRRIKTDVDTSSPIMPPRIAACRMVKKLSLQVPSGQALVNPLRGGCGFEISVLSQFQSIKKIPKSLLATSGP